MKRQQRRSTASFVVSVVFHAALAVVLANVVVHYEIVFQRQVQVPPPAAERVTYVAVSPPAGADSRRNAKGPRLSFAKAETGVSVSSRQSFQTGTSLAFAARRVNSSKLIRLAGPMAC